MNITTFRAKRKPPAPPMTKTGHASGGAGVDSGVLAAYIPGRESDGASLTSRVSGTGHTFRGDDGGLSNRVSPLYHAPHIAPPLRDGDGGDPLRLVTRCRPAGEASRGRRKSVRLSGGQRQAHHTVSEGDDDRFRLHLGICDRRGLHALPHHAFANGELEAPLRSPKTQRQ